MTDERVVLVGGAPAFRSQVSRALGRDSDSIGWAPNISSMEEMFGDSEEPIALVILSPAVSEEDAVAFAQVASAKSPTTAVILVRVRPPDGNLPWLIRSGIRDVVDLSNEGDDLKDAVRRALAWSASLRSARGGFGESGDAPGRVITVFSSKGGVGKTFLSCNLAAALAVASKKPTAVVDLNVGLGDVLPSFGKEAVRSFHDLMANDGWSDPESVRAMGTPLHDQLWGFGSPSNPGAEPPGGPSLGKALRALRTAFAYTVLDAPPQFAEHIVAACDVSDVVCLITPLDVIGVRHLTMDLEALLALGIPSERFRIVLNRANTKLGLSVSDVERVTGIQTDALIPSSALVPASLNRGRHVVLHEHRSPVAKAIREFANTLISPRAATLNGHTSGHGVRA
jgi:pilus assembly protein CpaE